MGIDAFEEIPLDWIVVLRARDVGRAERAPGNAEHPQLVLAIMLSLGGFWGPQHRFPCGHLALERRVLANS